MKKSKQKHAVSCATCGHTCTTLDQFYEEMRSGEWFIDIEDWTWNYHHKCQARII